jgi:hypothetical protein
MHSRFEVALYLVQNGCDPHEKKQYCQSPLDKVHNLAQKEALRAAYEVRHTASIFRFGP